MKHNIQPGAENNAGTRFDIPKEHLDEFIVLWERGHKERLTPGEAQIQATRLLTLYRLIARPLPGAPVDKGIDGRPQ